MAPENNAAADSAEVGVHIAREASALKRVAKTPYP
jgi:hypothetical protein